MDNNESLFFKIEQYLKGKLSAIDKTSFEADMEQNHALKEMVELHRFERLGQELLIEEDLKSKMAIWEQEADEQEDKEAFHWKKWLLIFLPLLLLVSIGFYYIMPTNKVPNERPIIEQKTTPLAPPSEVRGKEIKEIVPPKKEEKTPLIAKEEKTNKEDASKAKSTNNNRYIALAKRTDFYKYPENITSNLKSGAPLTTTTVLDNGIAAFGRKSFIEAIQIFKNIDKTKDPQAYEIAQEWLAHAYYEASQYQEAAKIFSNIIATSTMNAKDRAEWYLTLSLLENYPNNNQQINDLLSLVMRYKSKRFNWL